MANNLISDVMKMATPAIIDRIAAGFGVNANVVRNVLASAVPAIFAGLASQATTPGGLSGILNGLKQANPNIADSLGSALNGGAGNPMVTAGTGMLRSVLGDGMLNTIIGSITKNTGASAEAGGSLVAVAGQMAMSALAKQASGLDASGLGNLLSSQASLFQSSLPASLATALGGAGAMAAGAASKASATTTAAANSAASAARDAGRSATASAANRVSATASSGTNWLMWLIPLVVIAAGLWYFLGHKAPMATTETTPPAQTTTTTAPAPATTPPAQTTTTAPAPATTPPAQTTTTTTTAPATTPAAGAIMVDTVDVAKTLGDSVAGLTAALGGVTDAASATAAVAKLQDAAKGITTVSGLAAKFTPEQKTAVAAAANSALPALKDRVTKVEAMTGVGDVLKPVIDPVVAQLEALAKT